MRKITAPLIVLLASMAASACASSTDAAPGTPEHRASTYLEVTNNNWLDMAIYLVNGSTQERLGTVTSMTRERVELPASATKMSGEVRLVAEPIGSRERHGTPPIMINEGSRITWQIENHLSLSSYEVH